MEKDEARMDDLITSKRWENLTAEEQLFAIDQVGSEVEFRRLGNTAERLSGNLYRSNIEPEGSVLASLYSGMHKKKKSTVRRFWEFRVPAYVAALLFVAGVTVTLGLSRPALVVKNVNVPLTQSMIKKDTIYVTKTVVQERLVYRYVSPTPSPSKVPSAAVRERSTDSVGVSMKERGALDQLLVSMP